MQSRFLQITEWLSVLFPIDKPALVPIVGDASFRQYYRVCVGTKSYVVMDAPLDREKPDVFFRVARLLRYFGLNAPQCYAYDQESGFLLLDDFGDTQVYHAIYQQKDLSLYQDVLALIPKFWQVEEMLFPNYEESKFASELDVMKLWFWQWLGLDADTLQKLETSYKELQKTLVDNAMAQPNVFVFRDFHSKNIMYQSNSLGLIDFQDAVNGPITYDLVSILRDCYLTLPETFVKKEVDNFYILAKSEGYLDETVTKVLFTQWFDLMGLQRHLKCLGIFTRQDLQNKRKNYLAYLPRVMHYIDNVLTKYEELHFFKEVWQRNIIPPYQAKLALLRRETTENEYGSIQ